MLDTPIDIAAMYQLGLVDEVKQLGEMRFDAILSTPPPETENSHAAMGNYNAKLSEGALIYIETRQFDRLRRLGKLLVETQRTTYGAGWDQMPEGNANWEIALIGLKWIFDPGKLPRILDASDAVLPELLHEGAYSQAIEIHTMIAEAAMTDGAFETAEQMLVKASALAEESVPPPGVLERMGAVRTELNLSQLDALPPADKMIAQLNTHYSVYCGADASTMPGYWEDSLLLDFDTFADDPSIVAAIRDSNVIEKIVSCRLDRIMSPVEGRVICTVAAISNRQDVVKFVLGEPLIGAEIWSRFGPIESCAHGLADAGLNEWYRSTQSFDGSTIEERNIRFLMMSPEHKRIAINAADVWNVPLTVNYKDYDFPTLDKEQALPERQKFLQQFGRAFEASFGNMGALDSDRRVVANESKSFRRMGLYSVAEAYLFLGRNVDLTTLGTESEETLNTYLLSQDIVGSRIKFAKLYRAKGEADRAYAAIGPMAELAVARMTSSDAPLPGTLEQWSLRLRNLFTQYLEIQFEGLTGGPNYPAIFAIQQFLLLADSNASSSVLAQRLNSADPDLARQFQDAQRELRSGLDRGGDVPVAELSDRLNAIEAQLPQQDAALQRHQIGVVYGLRDAMRKVRDTGSTMLIVTQLPKSLVLTYLDGNGATAKLVSATTRQSQARVTQFRTGITQSTDQEDLFDVELAQSIYQELIGWGHGARAIPETLHLVVQGPYSTLPYAALRRGDDWLGAATTLKSSPSVARALAEPRARRVDAGFIGFGDPNLTQDDTGTRELLLGHNVALKELPETAAELVFLALAFGGNPTADVFTQKDASEAHFAELNNAGRISNAGILALATHGLLSKETGSLQTAGLVMSLPTDGQSDGILTAPEIYDYKIGADLVILSACNTGSPDAGESVSELASAFLYAGANALVLTHWEISSGAGVEVMKRVAMNYRSGAKSSYADLLRLTVVDILGDASLSRFHHPRFWASHFVFG